MLAAVAVAVADPGPRLAEVPSRQFVDTHPAEGRVCFVDSNEGVPRYVPVDGSTMGLALISPASSKRALKRKALPLPQGSRSYPIDINRHHPH